MAEWVARRTAEEEISGPNPRIPTLLKHTRGQGDWLLCWHYTLAKVSHQRWISGNVYHVCLHQVRIRQNPEETSPEVQDRGICGSTNGHVCNKFLKKNRESTIVRWLYCSIAALESRYISVLFPMEIYKYHAPLVLFKWSIYLHCQISVERILENLDGFVAWGNSLRLQPLCLRVQTVVYMPLGDHSICLTFKAVSPWSTACVFCFHLCRSM